MINKRQATLSVRFTRVAFKSTVIYSCNPTASVNSSSRVLSHFQTMPSLRIIAIFALIAASGVSSAVVPPIRVRRQGVADGLNVRISGPSVGGAAGPWLHIHCLQRVFSSIQAVGLGGFNPSDS